MKKLMYAGKDKPPREIARFWMANGELRVTWNDPLWQRQITRDGIPGMNGDIKMADAEAFYDGLDAAYAHASLVYVDAG